MRSPACPISDQIRVSFVSETTISPCSVIPTNPPRQTAKSRKGVKDGAALRASPSTEQRTPFLSTQIVPSQSTWVKNVFKRNLRQYFNMVENINRKIYPCHLFVLRRDLPSTPTSTAEKQQCLSSVLCQSLVRLVLTYRYPSSPTPYIFPEGAVARLCSSVSIREILPGVGR